MYTIFTKIIRHEIPGYILYEDDLVVAFLDVSQNTKGHTLVATKEEYVNIHAVPTEVLKHLFGVVQQMSRVLVQTFNAEGINLLNNNGAIAGQTVFHFHVHLLPRYNEKELIINAVNHMNQLTKKDYQEIQNSILKNWHK
ncbi:MAG: HIT family protein [Candidatus Phytoplasma pruni]|uniref:HIT family protein n=1 Tax=Milkweed yellows phytoplasma TaxID=208434 RepID=UPI000375388E|nr:HIT family protein [Milkweed yellows phytoplasma]